MKYIHLIILLVLTSKIFAQPTIEWGKTYGGSGFENSRSIQQTNDGGYIVAGEAGFNNGDVTGCHGLTDYWVLKLNYNGAIQWKKCFGGTKEDKVRMIKQTLDGGYIMAGGASSNDGDVSGNHGGNDFWIVKLDVAGNIQWQKCLGGTNGEAASTIKQTIDGGYIVGGFSGSTDGDVTGCHGASDYWVVKLSNTGNIEWQKCLGGTDYEYANDIQQTNDGGYIIAGESQSSDNDVSVNHGGRDYWMVKLDNSGTITWEKSYGGSNEDIASSIKQTFDGGYIVAGETTSINGDVTSNHGGKDYWILKLSNLGNIQWQKTYGGINDDWPFYIQQTTDSSYIVSGLTTSNDGDVFGNHGDADTWLLKLNTQGAVQWQKCLGGTLFDSGRDVQQTSDGGFVLANQSQSTDGDLTFNHGSYDFWVVKLDNAANVGFVDQEQNTEFYVAPNPIGNSIIIKTDKKLLGSEYQITSFDGKSLLRGTVFNLITVIDFTNFSPGHYIINIGDKIKKTVQVTKN